MLNTHNAKTKASIKNGKSKTNVGKERKTQTQRNKRNSRKQKPKIGTNRDPISGSLPVNKR